MLRRTIRTTILLAYPLALVPPARAQENVLYDNANIYTMNPDRPRAGQMLVSEGTIIAVGSEAEIAAAAQEVGIRVYRRIDLAGRTVIPGLIDAHGHLVNLGLIELGMLDLRTCRSYEEVIALVRARAATEPPGTWIVGRGWDNESWPDRAMPTHGALSESVPDHPVWLRRVDGHAGLANSAAMRAAGLSEGAPDPPGGEILRAEDGSPTGVFVDNAEDLIASHVASARAGTQELLLAAQAACLRAGLTGVHDAGVSPEDVDAYLRLEADGRLKLRIYAMLHAKDAPTYFEGHPKYDGWKLTVRAAKAYVDGAMGSRGAWLLDPYADRPRDDQGQPYAGLATGSVRDLETLVAHALANEYQVCTHAIGDRANREVLDAYERALAGFESASERTDMFENGRFSPRFRVEHAQLLSAQDIPRFAALGVIASMQPTHCTSDMRWVEARVGETRAAGAYAWASLARTGATLAFGSDFPVEAHSPFAGLYAAITRRDQTGQPAGGWRPEQCLTREEALRAFTLGAARAAFWETRTGSLDPDKLADFLVLDRDVMTIDAGLIPDTGVVMSVIAGEVVYRAP